MILPTPMAYAQGKRRANRVQRTNQYKKKYFDCKQDSFLDVFYGVGEGCYLFFKCVAIAIGHNIDFWLIAIGIIIWESIIGVALKIRFLGSIRAHKSRMSNTTVQDDPTPTHIWHLKNT